MNTPVPTESSARPISREAHLTVFNAGMLLFQKVFHLGAGLLIAIFLPRLMGPDLYGRYALLTSLAMWFALVSGMGSTQIMGRYVPQFQHRQDEAGLKKLFNNLLGLRLMNGVCAGILFFLLTFFWLRELDPLVLAVMSCCVFLRTGTNLLFSLFLGLNQAARWGAGELMRGWISLVLSLAGFLWSGLRGACAGLVLTEMILWGVGRKWAGSYLDWRLWKPHRQFLLPYLRFGLSFFGSNALLIASQRGGEMLLRLVSADYSQIAFYGLAYRVFQMGQQAIWQVGMGFIPYLTSLFNRGEVEQLRIWIERLVKWVTLASMLALLTWLFLGDSLVLLIFGRQYRPVVLNLLPLLAALPMVALSNVARMLALIQNRPGIAFSAATLQVATFWLAGVPLAARGGSFATCMTVLIASAVYGIYFTLRIRSHLKYSLKGWCAPLLMAIPFLALIFLRGSIVLNLSLWIAAVTGYSFFLISCRIISPQDFQLFRMAFTASGGIERHPHQEGTPD